MTTLEYFTLVWQAEVRQEKVSVNKGENAVPAITVNHIYTIS